MTALLRVEDNAVVCTNCEIAQRPRQRMQGLLGRKQLEPGGGLLLRPAPSIHTFFMRFPIDVLFLDWDLNVLRVAPNVRPFRIASFREARTVIELRAGEIERLRIEPGQRLELVGAESEAAAADGEGDRPRVVLASRDMRFVTVTQFLLTRSGFDVETASDPAALVDTVEYAQADVAVIDASDGPLPALRSVAAINGLYRRVGVVVVADSTDVPALRNIEVVRKWSGFEALRGQIETHLTPNEVAHGSG